MKYLLSFSAFLFLCAAARAAEFRVKSPDGKVGIVVTDAGGLSYSVFFDGREVVDKSRFGIIADGVDLGARVSMKKVLSRRIQEKYSMFGGHLLVQRSRKTRLKAMFEFLMKKSKEKPCDFARAFSLVCRNLEPL